MANEQKKTKLQRITGLWRITDGLSGNIGVQRIVILKNKEKKPNTNEPDYFLAYDTGKEVKPSIKSEKLQKDL